jgi:hypothetical protein
MNIPITKRVQQGGGKKGCGCPSGCNCGKSPAQFNAKLRSAAAEGKLDDNPGFKSAVTAAAKMYSPAKMWGVAKVAHGKKSSPAKMGCYGKKK